MSSDSLKTDAVGGHGKMIGDVPTELSSRRTGMSFQRTRMSADRTLMSVIRTALSLIGFGFTLHQVFSKAVDVPGTHLPPRAPLNFGIALVATGILLLLFGLIYHLAYMRQLRAERATLKRENLIHGESAYPVSLIAIVAVILLLIGMLAICGMVFGVFLFA